MDEMKLKLSTKFMRRIVSKILSKIIYKKTGCKIDISFNEIDISMVNGETSINANVEAKLNSKEFMKLMSSFDSEKEES